MFQVTREFSFAFAHRLINDSGPSRFLHGHNGKASVTLSGPALNAIGMVMDFVEMKQHIGTWLAEHFDHTTILHRADPLAAILQGNQQRVLLVDDHPTPAHLAQLIYERCQATHLPVVQVTVWESANHYAIYQGPDVAPDTAHLTS